MNVENKMFFENQNNYAVALEETNLIQFHVCPFVSLSPFLTYGLITGFFLTLGVSYRVSFHFSAEPFLLTAVTGKPFQVPGDFDLPFQFSLPVSLL